MGQARKDLDGAKLASLGVLAMLVYSTSYWALVICLDGIPPITMGVLRAAIAGIFMLGLFLFERFIRRRGRWLEQRYLLFAGFEKRRDIWLIFGTALFGTALPNVLQNVGMLMMDEGSTSSLTSIIQGVGPVFTIVLAWIILKEKVNRWKVSGLLIAVPATVVLTTYSSSGFDLSSRETLGAFLNLLTALCYSFSGLFLKTALNRNADLFSIIALNSIIGTVIGLPVLAVSWGAGFEDPLEAFSAGWVHWLSLIYLSVCIYAVTAMVWYRVIQSGDLSRITFYVFLLPLFSYIFGYIMLGDRLDVVQMAAGAALLFAVALAQRSGKDKNKEGDSLIRGN